MDEISFGPRRDFRLPSRRWLVVAAAAALIASIATVIITGGSGTGRAAGSPGPSVAAAVPSRSPAAALGTLLRTCTDANWGQLESGWRSGSFKAGPLWFVLGRHSYVHHGGFRPLAQRRYHGIKDGVMIVEVANGATAIMKPAPVAKPYFRFVDGFNGPSPSYLPARETA